MKQYTIEAVAYGTLWERDVNCPPGWRGSGCYDVEYTTCCEAWFKICARSLDEAVKEIPKMYIWKDYDSFFYDPDTVTEEKWTEDDDECEAWEIDHECEIMEIYERKEDAHKGMERYCEEIVRLRP